MASELARELSQLPFTKLRPANFRLQIATMSDPQLERQPVTIFIDTDDVGAVVKTLGSAKVMRVYSHLGLVLLRTYARDLATLLNNDLVRSVDDDSLTKCGGCVVTEPDPSALPLAHGIHRRTC